MTDKQLVPGLEGIPCAESAISSIDGLNGILEYRGYNIFDLAEHGTFEEIGYLLLHGELPTRAQLQSFDAALRSRRALKFPILDALKSIPAGAHPMKVVQLGAAMMGAFQPMSDVYDQEAYDEATLRLIAQLPTLVAAYGRMRQGDAPVAPRSDLSHAANFLYMLKGEEPAEIVGRTFDVALILHMEHTMNASTFTGRAVASTLADPYGVVSSAVGSLSGPLHGGANERALHGLAEIPNIDAVAEIVGGKIERREKIMGLGHRVYKTKDPRATILQGLAEKMLAEVGGGERYEVAKAVEAFAAEKLGSKGVYPNVDFYSGFVYDAMGIPSDLFTPLFAIARVVGWLAHAREQIVGNRIFRPTQVFVGKTKQEFVSIEARG